MLKVKKERQKWWVLFAMASCISMIFLDVTVLPVALPTLQRDLHFSNLGLQWIVNSYILALTLFVLMGGRLGAMFGTRRIFTWGLLTFALGSLLCSFSNTEGFFVFARILQGVGAALSTPNAVSLIFHNFPAKERGKAIGYYISIGSIFLALGPLIGGVFSEYLSWRYIFLINIPIAIVGFFLTLSVVPKIPIEKHKFDLFGFFLATFGMASIVVALMQVQAWGWGSPLTIFMLGIGILLLLCLIIFDRNIEDPYIAFEFFKSRDFSGAVIAIFCVQFLLMVTIFWAIYFQNVFNYSPAQAGAISLLGNAPILIAAPLGGHLLDKHGPIIPMSIGFVIITASLFWFVYNIDNSNIFVLLSATVPLGCGVPLVLTPGFTNALSEVSPQKRGIASGTLTTIRQFGGTIGLAIIGSLYTLFQKVQFSKELALHKDTATLDPNTFQGLLAKAKGAVQALEQLPPDTQVYVKQSYTHAFINAMAKVNTLSACIAIFAFILTLWMIRKKKQPDIDM